MTDLRKAAEMALEALDCLPWQASPIAREAAQALRTALSQPEQEPYGWISNEDGWFRKHEIADLTFKNDAIPLYTAPPKREWVGLTDED